MKVYLMYFIHIAISENFLCLQINKLKSLKVAIIALVHEDFVQQQTFQIYFLTSDSLD